MKTINKTVYVLAALLLTALVSCSVTGTYMPFKFGEIVIGTVQETLHIQTAHFSPRNKDAINTEVYAKTLEAAGKRYKGNIDIRDIVWFTTGRNIKDDPTLTEVFVTGKVIQLK